MQQRNLNYVVNMKDCRTVLGLIHEQSKNTVLKVHIHMTGGYSTPPLRIFFGLIV